MPISRALAAICVAAFVVVTGCSSAPPTPSQAGQSSPVASSGESVPSAQATPANAAPSRASLIQQAVASGSLDQVTGMVYRAESTLGLGGVPIQYSSGQATKDDGVFADMVTLLASLSVSDQERLTPFLVRPTDPGSIFGPGSPAATACKAWADSGSQDGRFKVWACSDAGVQQAQNDIANAVALIKAAWDPMTAAVPNGMGTPIPDAFGLDPSTYGDDARIDFYLVNLGQGFASAVPAPPYTNADGSPARTSSGYVLLNRSTLAGDGAKADVVHELFHVLEWAHNLLATHFKGDDHWFDEASATWAETYFDPDHSETTHQLFVDDFQTSTDGLESTDIDHEYSSYIWPFFMQQQASANAVFKAWADIGAVAASDFPGVTAAISQQLPFDVNFRDFALRNLNMEDVLDSAGLTSYSAQDRQNFPTDKPPTHIQDVNLAPDADYVSEADVAPPLGAAYWNITLAPSARLITISIADLTSADDADGDVLLHHATGKWEWRKFHGTEISFCRDDPGQDIDSLYLVVSDHGTIDPLTGSVEATASPDCSAPST